MQMCWIVYSYNYDISFIILLMIEINVNYLVVCFRKTNALKLWIVVFLTGYVCRINFPIQVFLLGFLFRALKSAISFRNGFLYVSLKLLRNIKSFHPITSEILYLIMDACVIWFLNLLHFVFYSSEWETLGPFGSVVKSLPSCQEIPGSISVSAAGFISSRELFYSISGLSFLSFLSPFSITCFLQNVPLHSGDHRSREALQFPTCRP